MEKRHLKKVIVLLTLIIILNTIFIPFIMPSAAEVKASSIEKEDIYTGLGIMFLMVVLGSGNVTSRQLLRITFMVIRASVLMKWRYWLV